VSDDPKGARIAVLVLAGGLLGLTLIAPAGAASGAPCSYSSASSGAYLQCYGSTARLTGLPTRQGHLFVQDRQ